jgi:DNA polymerase-3 subunit gamma/tau
MSYTVLARKYRPQTFSDLVGQEHVTRALGNAIASQRVAHAFLFTGVRGVGKTTSARILAKALNCERGPTAEPCNVCDACVQITQGSDLDVLEIDGASNNSVEDVRRLQESIPFRPARGRYKIVIVDEVHMLSTGAFNAFLKTLEEPPAHVKFIFATTESHKVPVTIRSRCQRYDFRLIPQSVIVERVRQILAAEKIEADDEALSIVAREAAGSMRDALTLLDQVVAFSGDKLNGREVTEKLGIADREYLHELARAVLVGNGRAALEVIERVATQGLDLLHFTRQWLDLLRDVVVLQVAGDQPKLVELSSEERRRALELGKSATLLELQRVFAGVAKLVDEVGKASTPRVMLEMGAVRLATRPKLEDLGTLIARVEELSRAGGGGGPRAGGNPGATPAAPAPRSPAGFAPRESAAPAQPPRETAAPAQPPRETAAPAQAPRENAAPAFAPRENAAPAFAPRENAAPAQAPRENAAPAFAPRENAAPAFAPRENAAPAFAPRENAVPASAPRPTGIPGAARPGVSSPAANPFQRFVPPEGRDAGPEPAKSPLPEPVRSEVMPERLRAEPVLSGPRAAPAQALALAEAPSAARLEPAPRPGEPASSVDPQRWTAIVERLRVIEPRWAAMYEHGVPQEVLAERVIVLFPEGSFFGRQAQTPPGSDALRRAAADVLAATPEIVIRLASEVRGKSLAQKEAAQLDERKEGIKRRALNHPRVLEALKVFPELAKKQDILVD